MDSTPLYALLAATPETLYALLAATPELQSYGPFQRLPPAGRRLVPDGP